MLKDKVETIIFDVDGTLSQDVSWLKLTSGLGAPADKHMEIFENLKKGEITYILAKGKLIKLWQKTGNANRVYMKNMFHSWKLKPDAMEVISNLRNKYRICLMSGAVDLYVNVVADKLGINDWYANTKLVWDKDDRLVDFHYHIDQANKKVEQFQKYQKKYKLDIEKCVVIGDGDSDLGLFKELPYGIAINQKPHKELESLAYKTIKKLSDLNKIF